MTTRSEHTVLEITPNLDIGGAQETVLTIAKYLPRHEVNVVVCSFRDGDLRDEIEALGVPVEILPARKHSVVALPLFLAEMFHRRQDLIDLLAKYSVSVIQTQGLGSLDFLVKTLARETRVWWTIQNSEFQLRPEHLPRFSWLFRAKRLGHRILYRLGQSRIQGVIAVSDETAATYQLYAGGHARIETIANSVDMESYPAPINGVALRSRLGFEEHDEVVIMVATFKRQKGHRHLVEAASGLPQQLPNLKVLLVGDGELRPQIERQVADAGLTEHFLFLGSRRDVPELLAASDLFVLPSLWEGLSVALLEAMASEIPVVATDVSGTGRVVSDGRTGLLVPPGDPEALAKAILTVFQDEPAAKVRAKAARELISSKYSADVQAKRLIEAFDLETT